MGDARPIDSKIRAQFLTDFDNTTLKTPTLPIKGLSLLELSKGISKVGHQIVLKGGLIAFDNKERIGLVGAQEIPKLAMGVQGIKCADASANGQSGKQFTGLGDLVGFFAHCQLRPDFLALVGEAGKQMRRVSFGCPGPSHGFAIDSERISRRGLAGGLDPCREDLFKALGINLRDCQLPIVSAF